VTKMTDEEKKRRANNRRSARIKIKQCFEVIEAGASISNPAEYGEGFARHVANTLQAAYEALWIAQDKLVWNGGKL